MIKQAIIPLAGLGTRLLPLTSVLPKELLPINGKPNLEYILEECLEAGVRQFIFIISKEKIRWQGKSPCDCIHFAYTLDENEKNLSYSYSEMPFWTKHPCGAIMELEEKWINGKHRTLFRGDTLKYIHDTSNVNPIKNDTLFTLLMLYGCISND